LLSKHAPFGVVCFFAQELISGECKDMDADEFDDTADLSRQGNASFCDTI
jgi:hypothetical protein